MDKTTQNRIKGLVENINMFEYDRMSISGQEALEEIYTLIVLSEKYPGMNVKSLFDIVHKNK